MFTVTRTGGSTGAISATYTLADGTATGGAACGGSVDYNNSGSRGSINFPDGNTTPQTITVPTCDDTADEPGPDETFTVTLVGANVGSPDVGNGSITDNDGTPSAAINDVTQAEGNAGTSQMTFTVTLSHPSSQTITVNYSTAPGAPDPATAGASCTAGVDYVTQSGSRTFVPGDTSEQIDVTVCGDTDGEPNERFVVNLDSASSSPLAGNVTIGDSEGAGTISNDDAVPPTSVAPGSVKATEDTNFSFTGGNALSVADTDSGSLTVTLTVTNGTLTMTTLTGLTFTAGDGTADTTMTFSGTIAALNTALATLTYTPNADYNGPASLTFTVTDNVTTPVVKTVNITVNNVNDAPVINNPGTIKVGTNATLDTTIFADDADINDTLTFSIAASQTCVGTEYTGTIFFTGPVNSITTTPTRSSQTLRIQTTPSTTPGSYVKRLRVSDLADAEGFFCAQITVNFANTSPVWVTTTAKVTEPSGTDAVPVQRGVSLTIDDVDLNQNVLFSLAGGTGNCGASPTHPFTGFGFSPNPVATTAGNESTLMTFNVGANAAPGPYCVRVNVTDRDSGNNPLSTVAQDITINVNAANSAPVINDPGTINVNINSTLDTTVFADDADNNETLAFSIGASQTCVGTEYTGTIFFTGPTNSITTTPTRSSKTLRIQTTLGTAPGNYVKRVQVSDGAAQGFFCVQINVPASAPTVTTNAATSVTTTGATLNGQANPHGSTTTGWFRYSTTDPGACNDTFGTRVPSTGGTSLGSGTSDVAFNQPTNVLNPNTTYYFCAIAGNGQGTGFGAVLQFTTPVGPPETQLTGAPPDPTNDNTPTFTFTGSTIAPRTIAGFECSVNAAPFAACISPHTTTPLADGNYNFQVRAIDDLNTPDPSPEVTFFTIDTVPPTINYGAVQTNSTANVPFTANVSDNLAVAEVRVFFSLNGGPFNSAVCAAMLGEGGPTPYQCTIPGQRSGTAVAYYVRATDTAGNNGFEPPATAPNMYLTGTGGEVPSGTYSTLFLSVGATLGGNAMVEDALIFAASSIVDTGGTTLTLGCNATVTGAGPNSYVVGPVEKQFCGIEVFTFPVGTAVGARPDSPEGTPEYSPLTASVRSVGALDGDPPAGFANSLTVSVVDDWLPGVVQASGVSRYWSVTETGSVRADLAMTYLDQDINGPEANYKPFRRSGGTTVAFASFTNDPGTNTTTALDVTAFSDWGIGALVPTAADVSISGRAIDANGGYIRGVRITVTGGTLTAPRTALTNAFGYYSIGGLTAGETYIITAGSKRYVFQTPSRVVSPGSDLIDIDFVADP